MSFGLQLRLLLWKNFTLRRRQKVRLVSELAWPLFLFLILMWVRTRGLKYRVHQCHFEAKAMPSAGPLPFLRSFVCSFNNTCHEHVPPPLLDGYNETLLARLVDDVTDVLRTRVDQQTASSVERFSEDLVALRQVLAAGGGGLQGRISLADVVDDPTAFTDLLKRLQVGKTTWSRRQLLEASIDASMLQELVRRVGMHAATADQPGCDPALFQDLLQTPSPAGVASVVQDVCSLPVPQLQELLQGLSALMSDKKLGAMLTRLLKGDEGRPVLLDDWSAISRLWRQVTADMAELESFRKALNTVSTFAESFNIGSSNFTANITGPIVQAIRVQEAVCGLDYANFLRPSSRDSQLPIHELGDKLRKQTTNEEYINQTSLSDQCNELFYFLETNLFTKLFWRAIKPLVYGRILYAPATPATDRLAARMNATFEPIRRAMAAADAWPERARRLRPAVLRMAGRLQRLRQVLNASSVWSSLQTTLRAVPLSPAIVVLAGMPEDGNHSLMDAVDRALGLLDDGSQPAWDELFNTSLSVADAVSTYLGCFRQDRFVGVANEKSLVSRSRNLTKQGSLLAGVVFLNVKRGSRRLPNYVRYKIRLDGDRVDSTKYVVDRLTRLGPRQRPYEDLKYVTYGFAFLQDILEHAIIEEQSGKPVHTGVYLHQMPYPCYIDDQFILAISRTFPMFMVLAWVYSSSMIIKSIVYEKEQRLKEVMLILGLSNGVHWVGWFITSLVIMLISDVMLTAILTYGKVLEHSDPVIVFLFLVCYSMSTITLSFLISTFFSRANLAAAAGGIIFFITYLPYPFLIIWDERLDVVYKMLGCVLSNVAFGFGSSYFAHYEERGVGIQWSTLPRSPLVGDEFSLLQSMLSLLMDSVLYALLAWYVEAVCPGQYGVPRVWYFPFTRNYWCGSRPISDDQPLKEAVPLKNGCVDSHLESEPVNLPLGVSVQNLCKVYPNGKMAVDNLTLNFYEGQITSFLGHNGAGKTTTICILTGLFPPTRGTVKIYNYDIRTQMDQIRQSLGICPQYNTLFHEMTVMEHLWFYSRLKGRPQSEVAEENERMVEDLGLPHKRDELAQNLSGGMQRKLSIAVALVGGSRTVILDEPTSGVDPYSRRSIWELLMKYKPGRTIILTTHFMDEADVLGDRIAIISQGALQCCGSSLFLKSQFGSGYYLTLARRQEPQGIVSAACDGETAADTVDAEEAASDLWSAQRISEDGITDFIRQHVGSAFLLENFGSEMTYVLPSDRHLSERLSALLQALDGNLQQLGMASYGLSDTSLEEIFLGMADDGSQLTERVISEQIVNATDGGKYPTRLRSGDLHRQSLINSPTASQEHLKMTDDHTDAADQGKCQQAGSSDWPQHRERAAELAAKVALHVGRRRQKLPLWMRHIAALHVKRFHRTRRNVKGLFCEIILPAFFVFLAMLFTLILPPLEEEPPLEVTPWIYKQPFNVFFSNDNADSRLAALYEDELIGFPGMGTRCVKSNHTCGNPPTRSQLYNAWEDTVATAVCSCDTGSMQCPAGATGPAPARAASAAGDILLNVTGKNVTDWLVKTRSEFFKRRWGGFTFGYDNPLTRLNLTLYRQAVRNLGSALLKQPFRFNWTEIALDRLERLGRESESLDNVKVWFNNKGWVTSAAYMNAFNNMLLRSRFNASTKRSYGIEVVNHPLNFTRLQLRRELTKQSGISLLHAICVIFALSFVPASFMLFLIEERQCKSKHVQFVSGLKPVVYWTAEYMWDLVNYLVPATLCVLIFVAFDEKAYVSERNLPGLVLLLLLYGWASIPLMYPASFVFNVPASAFVLLACANLFIGIVSTVATFVLEIFDDDELQMIAGILKQVFLVFPHYCLGRGLMDMAANQLRADALASFGFQARRDLFEWDFLGRNLVWMLVQGVVGFALTLVIEYAPEWLTNLCRDSPPAIYHPNGVDEDVLRERHRVLSGRADRDILRLSNLTKVYRQGRLPAVNRLCLGVKKGECFGLLGVNGAGKTSTFKMLTGDTRVTTGDAFICGHSVAREPLLVRQRLGYCPQFDALDALLTGREHLEFYGRLRGVPASGLRAVVERNISRLGLGPHADRVAGSYSGGNKRKLSTAVALIGDPPLVFLDEPTSGMDPKARRFLWTCITDIVREGRSVVLTSHSMEECEALCTRLAIMVNGQFKCLGSLQQLKSRFGDGYTVTLRSHPGRMDAVEARLVAALPQGSVRERHHAQITFQMPSRDLQLPRVFQLLESLRADSLVEDYSMSQTTLDEVFVRFAGEQTEMLEDEVVASRMSLRDSTARQFRGPKKVRFPASGVKAVSTGEGPTEDVPLNCVLGEQATGGSADPTDRRAEQTTSDQDLSSAPIV